MPCIRRSCCTHLDAEVAQPDTVGSRDIHLRHVNLRCGKGKVGAGFVAGSAMRCSIWLESDVLAFAFQYSHRKLGPTCSTNGLFSGP